MLLVCGVLNRHRLGCYRGKRRRPCALCPRCAKRCDKTVCVGGVAGEGEHTAAEPATGHFGSDCACLPGSINECVKFCAADTEQRQLCMCLVHCRTELMGVAVSQSRLSLVCQCAQVRVYRSPLALGVGVAVAGILTAIWVYFLTNGAQIQAEWSGMKAHTTKQRFGSQFGVLIAIIILPLIALSVLFMSWYFSIRFTIQQSNHRITQDVRRIFQPDADNSVRLYTALCTRNPTAIDSAFSTLTPEQRPQAGSLDVEAWSCPEERIGYVCLSLFDAQTDPEWELIEFRDEAYDTYRSLFPKTQAILKRLHESIGL